MKMCRTLGLTAVALTATAGLPGMNTSRVWGADDYKAMGSADRAGSPRGRQGNMETGTDNMRSGTDNTTPAGTSGRRASTPPPDQAPDKTTQNEAATALVKLHAFNQMEIEAGKLAQEKAQSPAVESFGRRLVRDHQAADEKVLALAKRRAVDLKAEAAPVEGDADHVKMQAGLQRLGSLTGVEFDREFLKAIENAHRKAVEFASTAEATAIDPQLKGLLSQLIPTLEKHHQIAANLMEGSARTTSTATPDSTSQPNRTSGAR